MCRELVVKCAICKEDIRPGQWSVAGVDQTDGTKVYAHWDCAEVVIRPGDMVGTMFPRLEAAYANSHLS